MTEESSEIEGRVAIDRAPLEKALSDMLDAIEADPDTRNGSMIGNFAIVAELLGPQDAEGEVSAGIRTRYRSGNPLQVLGLLRYAESAILGEERGSSAE
jgi:hypothetical protein